MLINELFENSIDPEQQKMDLIRAGRLSREREPAGSDAIDARLAADYNARQQYAETGRFWLKQKDTQQHLNDQPYTGKAAANAAALELLKQQPELRGNLVVTAYGPGETQGVAEGPNDGKEDNFTIDDIKNLERIRDLETLKAQAKELIKGKPARRMKPEKISWFYNHIDTLKNPLAVIKMMYDLMLAGEGNKVIGSRNSMSSNSYRSKFGEQDVAEAPGAETLGHNQSTVASNLNSLDLGEGSSERVGFSLDSERAYQAVMSRFGDMIDQDQDSGTMYAPERLWPKIEQVAYDADGIGAQRDDDLENPEHYGVAEGDLNEFAPAGRDPWGDDQEPGDDPYNSPKPEAYGRSIDFFGQFEADHFDKEDFNERTGVFKGYWENDDGSFVQIAYFKFDDPKQAEQDFNDSPGMGWYYEPQMESVAEGDTQLQPGMQVKDGTIVKVNGNTVTVKTSNGDLMNINIHDVDVAQNMAEGKKKSEPPESDYGADYQDMVARVKKLAGLGPLKTVWDPQKRVYKNVPTAVQPGTKK